MHQRILVQAALLVCFALLPTGVTADDVPTTDFAASYVLISGIESGNNYPAGWLAAATWYPSERFGVVGEVGRSYDKEQIRGLPTLNATIYNFMGGPKVVRRGSAVVPFAQALFGGVRVGNNFAGYEQAFASQFGGGIDLKVVSGFGVRAQADYRVMTRCRRA